MFEATKYIIGIVLMGLIVAGLMNFYAGGVAEYSPAGYNDTQLQEFKGTLNTISNNTEDTKEQLYNIGSDSSLLDIFGFILSLGLDALRTIGSSFFTLFSVIVAGVSAIPFLGEFANELILAFTTIVVLIFIGILFKVIFKVE